MCCVMSAMCGCTSYRMSARYWMLEADSASTQVRYHADTIEVTAPKGYTLWYKPCLKGDIEISYRARIMDEHQSHDRLSDLNCFWMASHPVQGSVLKGAAQRKGVFEQCYGLQLYYLGYGGNYNTTTRFRRYNGDARGITDAHYRPRIIKEYTDATHLLTPNAWCHIVITCRKGRTTFSIDGECIVDYIDPHPLKQGWFGFRSTWSRAQITQFKVKKL